MPSDVRIARMKLDTVVRETKEEAGLSLRCQNLKSRAIQFKFFGGSWGGGGLNVRLNSGIRLKTHNL